MQIKRKKIEYIEISYKPHQEESVMEYINQNKYCITERSAYSNGPHTIWATREL